MFRLRPIHVLVLWPVLGLFRTGAASAPLSAADTEFFENKIRPILVENCYQCHSAKAPKLKGGLSLEYRETLLQGGDSGPAIVPGDPDKSLLIQAVRYTDPDLQMPPRNKKLSAAQIADLTAWVKRGAPDPRLAGSGTATNKNDRAHWAFQPLQKPGVPAVADASWPANPVDNFVLAQLEANGMKPAPPADKHTLLRRVTFDLTGLPPTPQEMADFLADHSPDAYAKVVDRLLAAPRYGEHWARYWMDVARYSDTKGEHKALRESSIYPYAWTYRDYLIRAFNEDKPYNEFICEQLAADKMHLRDRRDLAAMGFLTVGDHFGNNNNNIINDRIDVVTKGFLGLTVTCARCHDHKFDPIPTQDYYSLRGIFASSVEPKEEPLLAPIKLGAAYDDFSEKYRKLNQELTALDKIRPRDLTKDQRRELVQVRQQISLLELNNPGAPPRAMVLVDYIRPADSPVFIRGEAENLGPKVPRRFLEILSGPNRPAYTNGSGRLELAAAIASPANPLTARVIVNRVWQQLFGVGFVSTPDDLGNQSEPPSHPELLDYLAGRFMADGWSLKKLERLIVLSRTYQESSATNPEYEEQDPHNRLLWRANIRRLEFEEVRDAILAIGGSLDLKMGGPPVRLNTLPYSPRRTIYGLVDRENLPEVYTEFDFANPDIETGRRYETLVPQQALFLMNSPMVIEQARKLVETDAFDRLEDDPARIRYLYERIYQREPTEVEIRLGTDFINNSPAPEALQKAAYSGPAGPEKVKGGKKAGRVLPTFAAVPAAGRHPLDAWDKYAHALMQANEAIFIN